MYSSQQFDLHANQAHLEAGLFMRESLLIFSIEGVSKISLKKRKKILQSMLLYRSRL